MCCIGIKEWTYNFVIFGIAIAEFCKRIFIASSKLFSIEFGLFGKQTLHKHF